MNTFPLKLHNTYYNHGYFNVRVDWDHLVRSDNGPVVIELPSGHKLEGHVNRNANLNGTARIFGGTDLRDWFQKQCDQGDVVEIVFVGPAHLRLPRKASAR